MMKRGRDLYESLQKCSFRLLLYEPNFFPDLVRLEELARIEVCQAALESLVFFVGFHRPLVSISARISWLRAIIAARGMEIKIELPGVKLGVVEADEARVVPVDPGLAKLMDEVCARKRQESTVESLAEAEPVRAVRAMFREWGMDPSKYRPSSEALLRRVVQGKGLYRVSNLVDMGNLGSLETGWPYGCYDRSKISAPMSLRHGAAGEKYEGIGKQIWHLEGRPVLADPQGPFGSPISDSTRSMITESATQIMIVIYAPARTPDASLNAAFTRLKDRLTQFSGACAVRSNLCAA
jgi:DNA/RNA-binding domain of Phe-tRNA-synthetase-like protein